LFSREKQRRTSVSSQTKIQSLPPLIIVSSSPQNRRQSLCSILFIVRRDRQRRTSARSLNKSLLSQCTEKARSSIVSVMVAAVLFMWLSVGYISSVARRSLTNSMRLINRIRARWFSFSGYYSSPHISKTAYLKQLIRKRHRPLLSLSDPPSPSSPFGSPAANPPSRVPSVFYPPPPVNQLLRPPSHPAIRSLLPCSLLCLLSPPPFDRRGLRLRSPRSVSCQSFLNGNFIK